LFYKTPKKPLKQTEVNMAVFIFIVKKGAKNSRDKSSATHKTTQAL